MHQGWRSRGYLPHCDERGLVQHIVFGLHDGFRAPPPTIEDAAARALWADHEFDRACSLKRGMRIRWRIVCCTKMVSVMRWRRGASCRRTCMS